jgi:hypothetical protein
MIKRAPGRFLELFEIDLRALALFRVSLALLILAQLTDRAFELKTFYTDEGLFPKALAMSLVQPWNWSIYFVNDSAGFTTFLFLTAGAFALLLLLGYQSRLAAFVSYFFIVSLEIRNTVIPNGGDYLLRLLTFWSVFLPLGARYSLDSRRNPSSYPPECLASAAAAGLLLQGFFVYFFTVLSKLDSSVWLNGEAVYDALRLEHYGRPLSHILLSVLPHETYKPITYAIMGMELGGSLLLFSPIRTASLRLFAIVLLALLQLGFALCLEVNFFPWAAITATLPFLPGKYLDKLERLLPAWNRPAGPRAPLMKQSLAVNALAGFCLLYIFISNLEGLTYKSPFYRSRLPHRIIPAELRWIGESLKLEQFWDMFMPPGKVTYWFVASGRLKDGTQADLLRSGAPIRWEKPTTFFKNEPWRAYLMHLGGARKAVLSPYVGPYFCREWNKKNSAGKRLEDLEVFLMSQENLPPPQKSTQYYASLLKYKC